MHFTKLRLVGFKSFVEPMEFVIERGLNGIVGPNGCGKSNLVEALRWVMGENSYKNMRASGMEDVIFSGSNTRPARNWAEVTLYLDNSERTILVPFDAGDEIQISRRIERGKGSIYRINSYEVRARDVQLLFADQSTGARSPSMVGQGRIGELIAAKPQNRRILLEEAAGISGLHSRRHDAELRLRGATANLERLDDITGELTSRIESLKRQVRQAKRFKILSREIRHNEAGLFYLRWTQAKSAEATAMGELNRALAAVVEQVQIQAQAVRQQEQMRESLPALREAAMGAAAAYQHGKITLQALEEEQKRSVARRGELQRHIEQLERDVVREQNLLTENDTMLAHLSSEEKELLVACENFLIEQEVLQMLIGEAEEKVQNQEDSLQQLTIRQAEIQAQYEQARRLLSDLQQKKQQLIREKTNLTANLQSLEQEMLEFDEIKPMRQELQTLMQNMVIIEEKMETLEEAVQQARVTASLSKDEINQIHNELTALSAEETTLKKMLFTLSPDSSYSIIEDVEVEQGFEKALGRCLGEELEAGIDRQCLVFWQEISGRDDPQLPVGVSPLSLHVKAPDVLARRLGQIGVVESDNQKEEIENLQKQLKTGQVLVNIGGALWRWDGLTVRAEAPSAATQHLLQKNRLREIAQERNQRQKIYDEAVIKANQAQQNLHLCEADWRQKMEMLKNMRQLGEKQRLKLDDLEGHHVQLSQCYQSLSETQKRVGREFDEIEQQLQQGEENLVQVPLLQTQADEILALQNILRDKREELQQFNTRLQAAKQAQIHARHRLETINFERQNWTKRLDNAHHQIENLQARSEEMIAEMEEQHAREDELANQRQILLQTVAEMQIVTQEKADILAQAESKLDIFDKQAALVTGQLATQREVHGRCEERLHAASEKCEDLTNQILEILKMEPHELSAHVGFDVNKKVPHPSELEQAIERAKLERERLGAVNLQAELEAQELSARYQAMTVERDDVIEAIKKLRQAIYQLNQEGRERLLAAFERVNDQFQRLFVHLFDGGTAELQLIESQDPLEAGLEIFARPPGKKPQTMTLLSGGEQALTATALIFAVFLTNPAPICVLDEVDAPLDDHNVERYCNLLDEMVRLTSTRFVVITHNPITMARMDRLFGVTMGEQAVSQLVSVDLRLAEQIAEAG